MLWQHLQGSSVLMPFGEEGCAGVDASYTPIVSAIPAHYASGLTDFQSKVDPMDNMSFGFILGQTILIAVSASCKALKI